MPAVRVATFNLLHGISLHDGKVDEGALRSSAAALGADLLALQEVDRLQPRSGLVDQTAVVAGALGATHRVFVPTVRGTPGEAGWQGVHAEAEAEADSGPSYGIGLVSRWPVRAWHVLRFAPAPVPLPLLVPGHTRPRLRWLPDEPRAAVLAEVDGPGGSLTAIGTHLSFVPGVNVRQLRRLVRWAQGFPPPYLLLGDLNLPGAAPQRFSGWRQLARVPTYPSYRPRAQFDHVLASGFDGLAVLGARAERLPVSDHCGLAVDLEL